MASSVIRSLIGWIRWIRKNNHAACAARFQFAEIFWRSRPNNDVKFSYLWFWRQREPAAVNLPFFAFTWKPFVPSKRKCTSPILYDVNINMEYRETLNLTQSSISNFKWRFCCRSRRSFLNSLIGNFNNDACSFKNSYWRVKGASDNLNSTEVWIST